MNRNIARWLLAIGVAAALMVAPVMAQDPLGAGEGQPVIWGNFGGDIATTNPILVNDGSSADVGARIYPVFIGTDPESGLETPGAARSLATDWSYSEDGTVLTFTLRDDWTWSDGTPITSADVKYAYDAIMSGDVDTPIGSTLTTNVVSLEAPDRNHRRHHLHATADCTAVTDRYQYPGCSVAITTSPCTRPSPT